MRSAFAKLLFMAFLIPFGESPAFAHNSYSKVEICYQNKYVEKYHPGTRKNPGYVSSREEIQERRCPRNYHSHGRASHKHQKGRIPHDHHSHSNSTQDPRTAFIAPVNRDNNSCVEGTIAGGVLGGALGGVLAKKDNWIWSIPAGVVGGAIVGCQVDGG